MNAQSHDVALPESLATRVKQVEVTAHLLEDDGVIPNNEELPLLVYPRVVRLPADDPAHLFEQLFQHNNWHGTWRNGIYSYHHYHSTAHEVLGIYRGHARVQLGGPHGVTLTVRAGDVVVIPAGVAHKNLGSSADFGVVGAYPQGQAWDMNYGKAEERPEAQEHIANVARPKHDPIYGSNGPLIQHWYPDRDR